MQAHPVEMDKELYQYGLVDFKDDNSNVQIICLRHGIFELTPKEHIKGKKCPRCSVTHYHRALRAITREEFIRKAKIYHLDRYDYSLVNNEHEDRDDKDLVTIICKDYGNFQVPASDHLAGVGCPKCGLTPQYRAIRGLEVIQQSFERTKRDLDKQRKDSFFLEEIKRVHGDTYDYSNTVYTINTAKIEVGCRIHGPFAVTAKNHLGGSGCPKCKGRRQNLLYLLRCNITGLYKIGVTTNNTDSRINSMGGSVEEIFSIKCSHPKKYEAYLHSMYHEFNVYNDTVTNGKTEFFNLTSEQIEEVKRCMIEASNITPEKAYAISTLLSLTEEQVQEVINYMKELK